MARLLALEWDAREARVAVARTRGREVVLEHAFTVSLIPRDPGQTFADLNVGEQIAAALAARNVTRCETLVAVGRASIELRRMNLPNAPPEELPDMVRFQALRQFTGIGEDWPLDFVPLDSADPDSLNVLAAAISPEMVQQIRSTCQAGELVPRRLVLRPFAAASLLRRRDGDQPQPCRLMVDLLADEADLTVLVDQQVALVRTVRLSTQEAGSTALRALVGEIRRTIAAAHNQLRDRRIERVILCGTGEEQAALKSLVESELNQQVETFDPFSGLELTGELRVTKPDTPGRFAPLLGMLLDEASGTRHSIDFLHPRRRPTGPSQRQRNLLIAAAVSLAVVVLVCLTWVKLANLDSDIETLTLKSSGLKDTVKKAEETRARQVAISGFLEGDIRLLDEMYWLAEELPSAEEVIITQVTFSNLGAQGGQIILDGYAREWAHYGELRERLRAGGHQVISAALTFDGRQEIYPWQFKETVLVEPRSEPPAPSQDGPAPETDQTASAQPAERLR